MENKNLYILIGLCLVIIAAGGILWGVFSFYGGPSAPGGSTASSTSSVVGFPSATTTYSYAPPAGTYTPPGSTQIATSTPGQTLSLAATGGGSLTVSDFLTNGAAIQDPDNTNNYILAGPYHCDADGTCPEAASTTEFSVTYFPSQQFFNVILNTEPLGQTRTEAEQFLEQTLGISAQQICYLQYYLGTTESVNNLYSGENLGFDGCSGATPLPQ